MDSFLRCEAVVGLAGRLVEGIVQPDRRELVEMHLLVCPSCLRHVAKLRGLRAALAGLPGRAAPEYLVAAARRADA